jgi:hypothetical protein
MISLRDFMEIINYRITDGSDFIWNCFGPTAYTLSSWNKKHDGYSLNIVFDTQTQTTYAVEACDYKTNHAYRLINPEYKSLYDTEVLDRSINDTAWDDVRWIDLESEQDFHEKACAIVAGESYDTRVCIPIDLSENELLVLFKLAHERDITFNDLVIEILMSHMSQVKKESI